MTYRCGDLSCFSLVSLCDSQVDPVYCKMINKKFIYNYVIPIIESNTLDFFSDYKSKLQEFVQTDKKSLEYILVNEEGPAHNKTFEIEVRINGILYGKGIAKSKKEAEQMAAKDALEKSEIVVI